MKKDEDIKIGSLGESIACKHLKNIGFSVIDRNYRKAFGEIDIIAKKGGVLHFVEVKTVSREAKDGIDPADNIHERKMQKFGRAVQSFLFDHKESDRWQIDALLIVLDLEKKTAKVQIIEL